MRWRTKARIQTAVSHLPPGLGRSVYYSMQRWVGSLRNLDALTRADVAVKISDYLDLAGGAVSNRSFLEVGTGWRLNVPIFLWLQGAGRITTVDKYPYLKHELVRADIQAMQESVGSLTEALGRERVDEERLRLFTSLDVNSRTAEEVLDFFSVSYLAGIDAGDLSMIPTDSIDVQISNNVFEHVSASDLGAILREAGRVVHSDGMCVNSVDFSDHFAHSDTTISQINFLQFTDAEWDRLAGNQFAYTNRLRADDLVQMYRTSGHELVHSDSTTTPGLLDSLSSSGVSIAPAFGAKSPEILATTQAWFVSRPTHPASSSGTPLSS